MESADFVWDHFKFNAEQRLKSFNFFLLLSIFANGGVFAAIQNRIASSTMVLLGIFVALLSVVFWLADARSKQLIQMTIVALKEVELNFPESHRLFAIDSKQQGRFVRYTFAFRILMIAQLLFGLGVATCGILNS